MAEIVPALQSCGFVEVAIVARFDPYADTSKEAVTRKFGVIGINLFARKPGTSRP